MNKIATYLQEHLSGEVSTAPHIRDYFATDGSILQIKPSMIVYPKNVSDVRKVTRFTWQLAEKGHVLPITSRGMGTDQAGAALGKGIIMAFPAHMNRLLELDTKQRLVRLQPGLNYRSFQDAVQTHGLFFPPYPSSIDYSTIGGAIANNSAGEKTIKYGATRKYVDSLEVVLANGELIQTGRISKRELNRKKGLTTFEGEVYRQLDGIITDNWDLIQNSTIAVSKNSAGYALEDVKRKDGSFDLTPLMVGSQGTLGVITEAILKLETYNPSTTLLAAFFEDIADASDAVQQLLPLEPSALEMVDKNLLDFINKVAPNRLKGIIDEPMPSLVLIVEFDDPERVRKGKVKKAENIIKAFTERYMRTNDFDLQQDLWAIRHCAAAVVNFDDGTNSALPFIEDGIVPREKFTEFIKGIYALFEKYRLQVAVWGHAGDANLHLQPFMDLRKLGDRQKVFKIMEEYYKMVISLGGSTGGEHNDGRMRAAYLPKLYGNELYNVFVQVKKAFDPHGTLNPGVKVGVELKSLIPMLRHEYSVGHLADHLPRT